MSCLDTLFCTYYHLDSGVHGTATRVLEDVGCILPSCKIIWCICVCLCYWNFQVVGNKTAKSTKKNCANSSASSHRKKRASKLKVSAAAVTENGKCKPCAASAPHSSKSKDTASESVEPKTTADASAPSQKAAPCTKDYDVFLFDNSTEADGSKAVAKCNVEFIDSADSFRNSTLWYPASKVLPWMATGLGSWPSILLLCSVVLLTGWLHISHSVTNWFIKLCVKCPVDKTWL